MILSQQRLAPGTYAQYESRSVVIIDLVDFETVVVKEIASNEIINVAAKDLLLSKVEDQPPTVDLAAINQKDWNKAIKIFEIIRPLVELDENKRSRKDVENIAEKNGKHPSTIYRWIGDYESTGLISSLIRKPRKDKGVSRLEPEVDKIINEVLNDFYLKNQRRSPASTSREIARRCRKKNLPPPEASTVRNRIYQISEEKRTAKIRGYKVAKEKYEPIKGHTPGADYPLALTQIDHTPMDVIVVDDEYRSPIGRAFLTILTDIFSRIILGFYITLEHPSALSTGICIANAIISKEKWLTEMGVDEEWPCWGVMQTIHSDNAEEFKGGMLGKASEKYNLILERRPVGAPNYGGHVERAFKTFMKTVHEELPGTTFSNVAEKAEYDSEGNAVMTLGALEKWFTLFILGYYHQKPHKGICDLPPIVKWKEGIFGNEETLGTGIPARVADEEQLRLDFLPYFERTIQRYGVINEGISYWSDALRNYVLAKDKKYPNILRKFICRYDPRNLSKIWIYLDEDNQYIEAPYRDLGRPPVSIWELREAKNRLKEKSLAVTNEELIFQTIDKMRSIVEEEAKKTKSARRKLQRRKAWDKTNQESKFKKDEKKMDGDFKSSIDNEPDTEIDIFPFDNIREPDE